MKNYLIQIWEAFGFYLLKELKTITNSNLVLKNFADTYIYIIRIIWKFRWSIFLIAYLICSFYFKKTLNDSPEPWALGFQDSISPGFTGIVELHDNIFFYLVVIAVLVFWMIGSTIYYFKYDRTQIIHKYLVHGTLIEMLWTILPAIVLLGIAIPSFRLLYILDEVTLPTITVKVTGSQWYWSYEYSDYETESGDPIQFDSYMIPAYRSRKSLPWVKLSNSENILKIVVPSNSWKAISGWINYSEKVTSYDMNENEMDYCGSKSEIKSPQPSVISVKEQRVDGSWFLANVFSISKNLRHTLMVNESCYQTENLSNQKNIFENVTVTNNKVRTEWEGPNLNKLDPWFITGFTDAEGCFSIEFFKDSKAKFNYTPRLVYIINLHVKDIHILISLKNTFGVGTVSARKKVASYTVKSFKELERIINHFKNYPLVSSKSLVFHYWEEAYILMAKKEHFNYQGITKLATLKSLINYGLSDSLKEAFPDYNLLIDTNTPLGLLDEDLAKGVINTLITYKFKGIPHGMWVAGFASGDGSFYTKMTQSKNTFYTGCIFKITLHKKDTDLLEGLYDYFSNYFPKISFNKYNTRTNKGVTFTNKTVSLTISNIKDIGNIIIPFFDIYPILGVKKMDYNDFKKIYYIIISKDHLNPEGIALIKNIRNNMNNRETDF
jgi:heme/copper-type cytochrome/quinol oxidase subunit 2